jgi:hypothetical protein
MSIRDVGHGVAQASGARHELLVRLGVLEPELGRFRVWDRGPHHGARMTCSSRGQSAAELQRLRFAKVPIPYRGRIARCVDRDGDRARHLPAPPAGLPATRRHRHPAHRSGSPLQVHHRLPDLQPRTGPDGAPVRRRSPGRRTCTPSACYVFFDFARYSAFAIGVGHFAACAFRGTSNAARRRGFGGNRQRAHPRGPGADEGPGGVLARPPAAVRLIGNDPWVHAATVFVTVNLFCFGLLSVSGWLLQVASSSRHEPA